MTAPTTRFERQPAIIARTADRYYELRAEGVVSIGAQARDTLTRWARTHGFAPAYVDERKPTMRCKPFDTLYGERTP